ncbi:hypothetical protein NIES4102_41660 (plasmid) [Chondrocystis sp. NIES-4102]|nr:hypothetical protein NIES4102_41660 [Chondrocystis sp. NIES-4102]
MQTTKLTLTTSLKSGLGARRSFYKRPNSLLQKTIEVLETSKGYIASKYISVLTNNKTGKLIQEVYYIDKHNKIGELYILNSRKMYLSKNPNLDSESNIMLEFKNIELM